MEGLWNEADGGAAQRNIEESLGFDRNKVTSRGVF